MNKAKIEACERLCREFLERAKTLKRRAEAEQMHHDAENRMKGMPVKTHTLDYLTRGTRESGALRRTSMDLTRALADLRRAG